MNRLRLLLTLAVVTAIAKGGNIDLCALSGLGGIRL